VRFAQPEILWLLWILPLLGLILMAARTRGARRAREFCGEQLVDDLAGSSSAVRRTWRSTLRIAALAALIVAAARPQWGASEVEVEQQGIDLVVALDISRSMLAEDIKPSRLTRAKAEIGDLVESLAGNRVGLVFFAGGAFPQCPLTVDYAATRLFLSQADPIMIGTQGTDIAAALRTSLELLRDEDSTYKVILLVTDGEDFSGGLEDLQKELVRRGILLYAIGIGTAEGAPVPELDETGAREGFVRDRDGNVVISRLDEAPLVELTRATGGVYVRAGAGGLDLGRLRAELTSLKGSTFAARRVTSYQERFAWPLGLGLLLLMVEGVVHDRRRQWA
jgi:Ca-activated chloride channel family protein